MSGILACQAFKLCKLSGFSLAKLFPRESFESVESAPASEAASAGNRGRASISPRALSKTCTVP